MRNVNANANAMPDPKSGRKAAARGNAAAKTRKEPAANSGNAQEAGGALCAPEFPGRMQGSERFYKNNRPTRGSLHEFWQWAYSGLQEKEVFRRFGIYVVAQALHVDTRKGQFDPGAPSDLVLPGNIRVSVRTDGEFTPSTRNESGTIGKFYTHLEYHKLDTGIPRRMTIRHKADAYVFARSLKIEPSPADLLCAEAWTFYVLTGAEMDSLGWGRVFVRLSQIEQRGGGPFSFSDLPSALRSRLKDAPPRTEQPAP